MYFESDTEILTIGDGATSIGLDMAPNVVYTFPAATSTLARTDAGQTFTGVQAFTAPTVATSIAPASADGATLGTAAAEFSDLYLAAGGVIYGENGQENTLTSSATGWTMNLDLTVTGADITLLSSSAGAKITGGDRTVTIAGTSANAENLVFTMGSNDNIVTVSSGTGATQLGFSALNLVTTGTISGGIPTLGTFASPTTSSGTYSLAAANAYGRMIFYNDTDTLALPAAVAGMNVCIYATSTNLTTIDPDGTDVIVVDGTANAAGDAFTLAAAAGNFVCLYADAANHWVTLGAKGALSAL
jgi:hypothetical protein